MKRENHIWGTENELKWIRTIGDHSNVFPWMKNKLVNERKIMLLENYLKASELRVNWEVINKEKALALARKELSKYRDKMSKEGVD
jgi:hypothetical protein